MITQKQYISLLLEKNEKAVVIGSLGTISRDLLETKHRKKILIRGAMGLAMSVGLGYAMNTDKEVIVLIGDGSFLMKMGAMSTILKYKPKNLKVIILQNNCYASTGKQPINFKEIKRLIPDYFHIQEVTPD